MALQEQVRRLPILRLTLHLDEVDMVKLLSLGERVRLGINLLEQCAEISRE